MCYYGARYYDPAIGRFISPDTFVQNFGNPQSFNRYTYVYNNPLKYTDPSGHFAWFAVFAVVRAAIFVYNVVTTVNDVVTAVKDPSAINIVTAAVGFIDPTPGNKGGKIVTGLIDDAGQQAVKHADEGMTPLYRAVNSDELTDLDSTSAFNNLGQSEGKYFSTTPEGAAQYAQDGFYGMHEPPKTIVQTGISTNSITDDMLPSGGQTDRGVPTVFVPDTLLPTLNKPGYYLSGDGFPCSPLPPRRPTGLLFE